MKDTRRKRSSGDDSEPESGIVKDIEIQLSEIKRKSDTRLATLKILLQQRKKKLKDAGDITMHTEQSGSLKENSGVSTMQSERERHVGAGGTGVPEGWPLRSTPDGSAGQTGPLSPPRILEEPIAPSIVDPRLVPPASSLDSTSPTSEIVASQSMSLLDESANHMFGLMKGLHANQPPAEVRSFDPERVNSAVACANTIYKIMRLKLDAIKVQRKLTK